MVTASASAARVAGEAPHRPNIRHAPKMTADFLNSLVGQMIFVDWFIGYPNLVDMQRKRIEVMASRLDPLNLGLSRE
jgi:hypothetical protein